VLRQERLTGVLDGWLPIGDGYKPRRDRGGWSWQHRSWGCLHTLQDTLFIFLVGCGRSWWTMGRRAQKQLIEQRCVNVGASGFNGTYWFVWVFDE